MKFKLKSLRILIAEDNLINQKILKTYLSRMDHTSIIANNGKEAIDINKSYEFDCILMDIQMPKLNGLEATKKIRKLENGSGKHLPIIAVTSKSRYNDCEDFYEAGMDEFIPKPVNFDLLKSVLNNVANNIY
jgi:CheY-like chemotaxis protein